MKLLICLSLALLLSACHTNSYTEKNSYTLSAKNTAFFDNPVNGALLIEDTQSTLQYRNRHFIYRLPNNRFIEDFYNQFATSPGQQLTQLTVNWFKDSHLFNHVLTTAFLLPGDYTLKSKLTAINADYSDSTKPKGTIEIEYILLHGDTIILDKTYQQDVLLAQKSTPALLAAWNNGAVKILSELSADIAQVTNAAMTNGNLTAPTTDVQPAGALPKDNVNDDTAVESANNYLRLEGY